MILGAIVVLGAAVLLAMNSRADPQHAATVTVRRASTTTTRTAPSTTRATTTTAATTTTTTTAAPATSPPTAPPATTPVTPSPTVAAATTGPLGALRGKTIAIDPGHNGDNYAHTTEINRQIFIGTQYRGCDTTGTQTDDGYTESSYTLDVAFRLRSVLQATGANVVMTRTTNDGWGPCIDQRAAIGNDAHADAAISIHADGGPASGRGFHVLMPALINGYTDDIYAASHRLGVDVRDAFTATGMPTSTYYATQGLIERTDLGGLNLSNVPKVFIETGNMRNATDTALVGGFELPHAGGAAAGRRSRPVPGGRIGVRKPYDAGNAPGGADCWMDPCPGMSHPPFPNSSKTPPAKTSTHRSSSLSPTPSRATPRRSARPARSRSSASSTRSRRTSPTACGAASRPSNATAWSGAVRKPPAKRRSTAA